MSIKVSVFIATSLDGFIARPNGSIDWLPTAPNPSGEDYGYSAFMDSVDGLVMGRNTFEKVLTFGEWPYPKPVVVLSSRPLDFPLGLEGRVEALNLEPADLLRVLEERGWRHIYLDGGVTIQRFLREGLVEEMIITTIPVLIGEGLPLFGPLRKDVRLSLVGSRAFEVGFVQNRYRVVKESD